MNKPYIGRFAPSPTGLLHLGSLTCALASYLDARHFGGRWLLRIEDIDPPREQVGAAQAIIRCLAAHGMESDTEIMWQSQRSNAYRENLEWLQQQQLVYPCTCSRQRLSHCQGIYDGHCRHHPVTRPPYALRLKTSDLPEAFHGISPQIEFYDRHLGQRLENLAVSGDFIIHRKDGLFAYQLAVVIDDIAQGITHVVRGNDILDTTARQIYLFQLLQKTAPEYCHIPVVSNDHGQKLSKQNHATPVNLGMPGHNLWKALTALGALPPADLAQAPPAAVLEWATQYWTIAQLPHRLDVPEASLEPTKV